MSTLTKCSIAHKALSVGTHRFDFKIGDRFFEAFEGSEIHRGKADVQVVLNKQSSLKIYSVSGNKVSFFRFPITYLRQKKQAIVRLFE